MAISAIKLLYHSYPIGLNLSATTVYSTDDFYCVSDLITTLLSYNRKYSTMLFVHVIIV